MAMAGGAILGYCATGRLRMDKAPAIIRTMAITQAKTGLSIKNFAMRWLPYLAAGAWPPCPAGAAARA